MRRLLANRTFGHLFAAQVVALVGTGLLTVALGLLAYDLAPGSASAVLGTALTIKIVAYVVLSPVVATLAERVPRRVLLVGSDVVRAAVALLLPLVDQVWQVYVLVFVLQAASAAFTPAFQAVIPAVLPDERDYTRALSLSRLAYDLESLLSPVLAGVLLTVVGYHVLFVGTVLGFVGSALLVVTTRLPALPPAVDAGGETFARRATHGTRRFWATPQLRALLWLDLAVAAATALVLVNTVVAVREVLGRGDTSVAVALAAYGAGSMVVALALPGLLDRVPERRVMLPAGVALVVGVAASVPLLAGDSGWPLLLALWVALGAATSAVLTPSARLLRRHSRDADRSAIFAAQFSLSHACYLLTYPVAGWVGTAAGLPVASAVLTLVAAVATAAAFVVWPRVPRAAGAPQVGAGAH